MADYATVITITPAPALPERTRRLLAMFNPKLRPAAPAAAEAPPDEAAALEPRAAPAATPAPRVESTYFRNRRLRGAR